jgi:TolA-binding protein
MRDKTSSWIGTLLLPVLLLLPLVVPTLAWADNPADNPGVAGRVAALEAAVASLQNTVATLQATVSTQQAQIAALQTTVGSQESAINAFQVDLQGIQNSETIKLNQYLTVATDDEQNLPLIRFAGVNLQLVNGEGAAEDRFNPPINGLGNFRSVPEFVGHPAFTRPWRCGPEPCSFGP